MKIVYHSVILGIACFFAVMWGMVLRDKIVVEATSTARPNYEQLLSSDQDQRKFTMGIYVGGRRLGETRTRVRRDQSGTLTVISKTTLYLRGLSNYVIPAGPRHDITFHAIISPLFGLQTLQISSESLDMRLFGRAREGRLEIAGTIGGQPVVHEMPYNHAITGEMFSPLSGLPDLNRARVGDTWMMHLVNPLLGSVERVRVQLAGSRVVRLRREKVRLHRLIFFQGSKKWRSWVSGDGKVLVQGTPLPVTLYREGLPARLQAALREEMQKAGMPIPRGRTQRSRSRRRQ